MYALLGPRELINGQLQRSEGAGGAAQAGERIRVADALASLEHHDYARKIS